MVSVPAPREIHAFLRSPDGSSALESAAARLELLSLSFTGGSLAATAPSGVPVAKVGVLLETELQHQKTLHRMRERTARVARELEEARREVEAGLRAEFQVPPAAVGAIIGKKGSNLRDVEDLTGVMVVVDTETATIRIRGPDADSVHQARDLLEYAECIIEIPEGAASFLIGTRGATITSIEQASGVDRLTLRKEETSDKQILTILGRRTSVETARVLVETKLDHFAALESARAEERRLEAELEDMERKYRPPTRRERPADQR